MLQAGCSDPQVVTIERLTGLSARRLHRRPNPRCLRRRTEDGKRPQPLVELSSSGVTPIARIRPIEHFGDRHERDERELVTKRFGQSAATPIAKWPSFEERRRHICVDQDGWAHQISPLRNALMKSSNSSLGSKSSITRRSRSAFVSGLIPSRRTRSSSRRRAAALPRTNGFTGW